MVALKTVVRRATEVPWLLVGCVGIVGTYTLTGLTTDMRFYSIVPALTWIAVGIMRAHLDAGDVRFAPTISNGPPRDLR